MRPLTFQVKLPPPGKVTVELLAAKSASPKGSPPSFGHLVHGGREAPASHGRPPAATGGSAAHDRRREHRDDPTDPRMRHAAQLGPPPGLAPAQPPEAMAGAAPVEARARTSLEELLPALVRRVAWSGDGRRGTVRLELGSGQLAGAELVIHAEDGRVRVQLRGPAGVDLGPLRERIAARLAQRGVALEDVE